MEFTRWGRAGGTRRLNRCGGNGWGAWLSICSDERTAVGASVNRWGNRTCVSCTVLCGFVGGEFPMCVACGDRGTFSFGWRKRRSQWLQTAGKWQSSPDIAYIDYVRRYHVTPTVPTHHPQPVAGFGVACRGCLIVDMYTPGCHRPGAISAHFPTKPSLVPSWDLKPVLVRDAGVDRCHGV